MNEYRIKSQSVSLGAGHSMRGFVVTHNGHFNEFFKYAEQARRYVERQEEELTRDG